jgi:hypothetical protein
MLEQPTVYAATRWEIRARLPESRHILLPTRINHVLILPDVCSMRTWRLGGQVLKHEAHYLSLYSVKPLYGILPPRPYTPSRLETQQQDQF